MKYAVIVLSSLFVLGFYAMESIQQESTLFPGVKKINDDLYVGKVADDFYLAMERVDNENLDMWRKYALNQEKVIERTVILSMDGIANFRMVVDDYGKNPGIWNSNELWIAYASRKPVEKKANLNIYEDSSNPDIEMIVTVLTTPDALIDSHMGITRTWEAEADFKNNPSKRKKHPDQSIHLHSFAAKVMKMRDSKKVYMLTTPAGIMRQILVKKMPKGSVFIGDNLYKQRLLEIENDPKSLLSPWALREKPNETSEQREERIKKSIDESYAKASIKEKLNLLKTHPPRIKIKEISDFPMNIKNFTIEKPNGESLVEFDLNQTKTYQWLRNKAFNTREITIPYVLVDADALANATTLVKE